MQYKILSYYNHKDFEKEVNRLLGEGWRLHGMTNVEMRISYNDYSKSQYSEATYHQAMIKE